MALESTAAHFHNAYSLVGLVAAEGQADAPALNLTTQAIRQLGQEVRARNPEALTLLMNLTWHADSHLAGQATWELLQAYADPGSDADLRAAIREQAFQLFDVSVLAPGRCAAPSPEADAAAVKAQPTFADTALLPTEILYLAGLHANHPDHRSRLGESRRQAEAILGARLTPAGLDAQDNPELAGLLDRGRFTTQSELIASNQRRVHLRVHPHQIDLQHQASARGILGALQGELTAPGDARTVFIKTDAPPNDHWVAAVLVRMRGGVDGTFQCLLFDSLHDPAQAPGRAQAVLDFLSDELEPLTKFRVVGGMLQDGAPNACGVYATKVAGLLDDLRFEQRTASVDDMADHLDTHVARWKSLGDEGRDAMITRDRALMLARWAREMKPGGA